MPLTGTAAALQAAIKSTLQGDPNVVDNASLDTLCEAIATNVLTHLLSNATITFVLAAPSGGGPVTGTITLT